MTAACGVSAPDGFIKVCSRNAAFPAEFIKGCDGSATYLDEPPTRTAPEMARREVEASPVNWGDGRNVATTLVGRVSPSFPEDPSVIPQVSPS